MPNSPRMTWPYPSENQDPWYTAFENLIAAIDASVYAAREDRNLLMGGGGLVSFTASTGVLAWDTALEVYSTIAGFRGTLAAGNVVLADGQLFYVTLTRAPTGNQVLTASVASQVPTNDNAYVIGIRRGSDVYFRFGSMISDGDTFNVFEGGGGGGGTDTYERDATFSVPDGSSATQTATVGRVTYAGSIIGLSVEITEAVVSGTITINVRLNGAVTLSTVLNSSFPTSRQVTVSGGTHAVVQNDAITIEVVPAAYDNASGNPGGLTVVTTFLAGVATAPPDIPDASNIQKGITRLSAVPLVGNDPIAVGDEDPRVDTWTRSGTDVNLINSGDTVHAGGLELDMAGTANYFEAAAGTTAAVSGANTGRIRYNESVQRWQISENTGAYTNIIGSGADNLDEAYDGGGSGAGRTITVDAGAVQLNGNAADNNNVLEVRKQPGGAQSGNALDVLMNASASGLGLLIRHDGLGTTVFNAGAQLSNTTAASAGAQQQSPDIRLTGQGFATTPVASQTVDWRMYVLPVEGTANPSSELRFQYQINGGGFTSHTAFSSGNQILAPDGASGAPGYSFATTPSQGIYRASNNVRVRATTGVGLQIAGTIICEALSTGFHPNTTNTRDLGTSSVKWRDIWLTRQINADSTEADNNSVVNVSKVPAGSQSGNGINVTMGANTTGWGLSVTQTTTALGTADLATAPVDVGILLLNNTAATISVEVQSSPALRFEGRALDSGNTSQPVAITLQMNPEFQPHRPWLNFWVQEGTDPDYVAFVVDDNGATLPNGMSLSWQDSTLLFQRVAWINVSTADLQFHASSSDTLTWTTNGELYVTTTDRLLGISTNRWRYLYTERINAITTAATSGTPDEILFAQGGAHTDLANVEHVEVLFDMARNISFAGLSNGGDPEGGSPAVIATQRHVRFTAPTYVNPGGAGFAYRITDGATVAISGAPVDGGTAVSITNPYALWVESGTSRFDGQVRGPAGSASAPSFSPADANTGMYSVGADTIGWSTNGTLRMTLTSTGLLQLATAGSAGAPTLTLGADTDSGLFSGGDGIVAVSGNATEIVRWSQAGAVHARQNYTTPSALSYGANISVNAQLSNVFTVTLTGATAQLDNPSNLVAGMTLVFVVTQDGTGGRALTFDTNYSFGDEGAPDLTGMLGGTIAVISCLATSGTKLICSTVKGYA